MLFSSWQFIFAFLPVTLGGFLLLPANWRVVRKVWLVLASFFFYAYWKVDYIPLLVFSILFNYGVAEVLLRFRDRPAGPWILASGIAGNLGLLGYFKYANFLVSILGQLSQREFDRFDIILPLAISFFTFTQIAYLVDVYRDHTRHYRFLDYALFVVFFPHLIAGPIVRHWEIIPQYADQELRPKSKDVSLGGLLFLLGLFKKMLLADPVSKFAVAVYSASDKGLDVCWSDAWLGTLAFAIQIYFDFSGYSDMAIGLARLFGIKFPANFDSPYRACSIIDFWRRWHMTLTRFFREYVYFSLGGNRCGVARQNVNLMATMLLSGLWHGAGWNFVIWGGLHGFFLLVNHHWRRFLKWRGWKLQHWSYRGACALLTFLLVLITWVLFRASNLPSAGKMLASMAGWHGFAISSEFQGCGPAMKSLVARLGMQVVPGTTNLSSADYREGLLLCMLFLFTAWFLPNTQQLLSRYEPTIETVERAPAFLLRLNLWAGMSCGVLFFFVLRSYFTVAQSPFLYFNF